MAVISLFLCVNLNAQDREYSYKETYDVGSKAELSIKTIDGFIDVLPSDKNEIEVYYIVRKGNRFMDIDRRELERELEVNVSHHGNELRIEIRHPNMRWNNWKNRYNVSFEIYVPKQTMCTLQSSDGNIYLRDVEGDQYCKTSDGNIKVKNILGDLEAKTSDGNVSVGQITGRVKLKSSDGDILADNITGDSEFVTSDGDIDLFDVRGDTYVHTSDGSIKFRDLIGSISGRTSDGSITGNFMKLKGNIELRTSDGDIKVTIPDGLGLELRLRGERVYTELRNFSGNHSKKSIKGTVGDGEFLVDLSTSDGRITLDYY